MRPKVAFSACLLALSCLPLSAAHAAATYTVTDLGASIALDSGAAGLNDIGQVVGVCWFYDWMGYTHAFAVLWDGGIPYALWPPDERECNAMDINNAGQIVGRMETPSGTREAYLWEGGVLLPLGTLGGEDSYAMAINNAGQIVGSSGTQEGGGAFIWQDGVMTSLGLMEGGTFSTAHDINDVGQIVGMANGGGQPRFAAFLWEDGVMSPLVGLQDAHAINDLGQVVGRASGEGINAAMWDDGVVTPLGALVEGERCQAWDINNRGQIVGESGVHAFLWEDGIMYDLNDFIPANPEWRLSGAHAINEHGQIAGWGRIGDGEHAFLLTPIPEPSPLFLAGLAALALLLRRTARR